MSDQTQVDGAPENEEAKGPMIPDSPVSAQGFGGDAARLLRLRPPSGRVAVVLDTDAANEIDDQFALTYACLSTERLSLEAVYAAPFVNDACPTPEMGMSASHEEIVRVLDALGASDRPRVVQGARRWLAEGVEAASSPAAADLVTRANAAQDLLYVVAIGAPTNVAAAIATAPEIVERIVVVWLGGNAAYWHRGIEYNAEQDLAASRVLFDSRVPLIHVPCYPVTEQFRISGPEIDRFVRGRGSIGDLLADLYDGATRSNEAGSRILWDLGPIAWFVDPTWMATTAVHSPILTSEGTWSHDTARHLIAEVRSVDRDAILADLFGKLGAPSQPG